MKRTYDLKSDQTIETLNTLQEKGIKRFSVILRHSERFFTEHPEKEPFMGLTPAGKTFAFELGRSLAMNPRPKFYSSMFGRCIETAYLIDKGYTHEHGGISDHNTVKELLAPFYIKDIDKAVTLVQEMGTRAYVRHWFDKKIDGSIMEDPEKTADIMADVLVEQTKQLKPEEMAVCVSHDWNLFPLKEFKLGLKHETCGDVGYLESVIVFEEQGEYYISSAQSDPVKLY